MKKRRAWLWIALSWLGVLSALALTVVGVEFYERVKDGRSQLLAELEPTVYEDGYRQFQNAYLTDVYFEEGEISYTVVNQTPMRFSADYNPDIYRKVDGEWVLCDIWAEHIEPAVRILPHTTGTYSSRVRRFSAREDIVGEYRLVYGHCMGRRMVGHLTITEEMVDYMGIKGELYYTEDGIRQHTGLTVEDLRFDRYVVSYRVTNNTAIRQSGWYLPVIEKKVNGQWQSVTVDPAYDSQMSWRIETGESAEGWFHLPHDGSALVGEYRFIFGGDPVRTDENGNRYVKYDGGLDHIVVEFTVTEEMIAKAESPA